MEQGKCKLDFNKNPIIKVTPLGNLPQVSGHEKVTEWLDPTSQSGQKKRRMDNREISPSTSTGLRANQPSITPKPLRTARAQIRAMATVATIPQDGSWKRREFFNPGLTATDEHQQRSTFVTQVPHDTPPTSPSHHSPPVGVEVQGPSQLRDLDSPHSHTSRTTILAQPLSQAPSSSDLSLWAERLLSNLGEPEGPSRAPGSSTSSRSSHDLMKDLLLSDDSSSLPEVFRKPEEPAAIDPSGSETTISDDNLSYQHRPTPTTLADPSTCKKDRPNTLHQAITDIGSDLETLVALNRSVQPPDQLLFLEGIHARFQSYLAPYKLYHS